MPSLFRVRVGVDLRLPLQGQGFAALRALLAAPHEGLEELRALLVLASEVKRGEVFVTRVESVAEDWGPE